MKYKVGDEVKIDMTRIQCGDEMAAYVDRLPNRVTVVESIFGSMYALVDIPFVLPEESLKEILDPITSRFELLDL